MSTVQTLLEISAYAIVIFAGILLFRRLFHKRLSPFLKYALWFVLIARLLLPVTLDSGVRLFALPSQVQAGASKVVFGEKTAAPSADVQPAAGADMVETPAAARMDSTAARGMSWWTAALIVYLAGAAAAGSWMIVSYATLRRSLRRDAAEPTERLNALLAETKAELGIRGEIRLACAYSCGAPALVFPRILFLPLGALVSLRDEELKNVYRHELTHHRRGDPVFSVLLAALCAVYWFNPVVWIFARLMRADMEAACDAAVTRMYARNEKEGYARLLLSLYALPALGAPALGLSGRGVARQAEKRVRGVFSANKSALPAKIAALALVLALAFGCFTTACQPIGGTGGHAIDRDNPWISDVPVTILEHVEREAETLQKNVFFTVDADVTAPKTYEQTVVNIERRTIDYAAFQALLKAVMPEAEWTAQNEPGTGMTAVGERGGETYTAHAYTYSDGMNTFSIYLEDVNIIREGDFVNSIEMDRIYAEQVRKSIRTTAAELRPLADAVVEALGANGMMLQSAERACGFDTAVMDDTNVLSRGWCFIYVPSCGGLPCTYRGDGSSYAGALSTDYYGMPMEPVLSVYVDENGGVSMVEYRDLFNVLESSDYTKPLISYEDVLARTKQLLQKLYTYNDSVLPVNIDVTAVQLAACCVGDGKMSGSVASDYKGESGSIVPIWEVVCTFYNGEVYQETIAYRFNATDGGALLQQQ